MANTDQDIPEGEYKELLRKSWPARCVKNTEELKEWLQCGFLSPETGADYEKQYFNFCGYVRKVKSLGWINALHNFEGDKKLHETPLMYVLRDDPEFLLSVGADPNIRDSYGKPPLWLFFENSMLTSWKCFHYMMEAGANPKGRYRGKSVVELSKAFAKSTINDDSEVYSMIWDEIKMRLVIEDEEEYGDSDS